MGRPWRSGSISALTHRPTCCPAGDRRAMSASNELIVCCDPTAIRRARHFARRVASTLRAEADTLELLVSELVTNAVLHGAPPVSLRIEMLRDRVHVAVADTSPRRPLAGLSRTDGMTGRGLGIVEALAAGWGVDSQPDGGKVVWADVAPVPQPGRSPGGEREGQAVPARAGPMANVVARSTFPQECKVGPYLPRP